MDEELKFITEGVAKQIKELVKALAKDCVKSIYKKEKEICSFGIFTDSDASRFLFGYNTIGQLDKIIKDGIDYKREFSEHQLSDDFLKWWLPEWKNEIDEEVFHNDPKTKEIFKIMNDLVEPIEFFDSNCENDFFIKYKEDVFDLFCQVLRELKEEHVFSRTNEDFYLLVQEHDNGVYGTRERSLLKIISEKQLNELLIFGKHYLNS